MKTIKDCFALLTVMVTLAVVTGCHTASKASAQDTSGTPPQAQTVPGGGQGNPSMVQNPSDLSWPRYYATNGYEFAVYQPQISSWPSNLLDGRFVVAIRPAGTTNETYGVVFFQARTEVDKVNRLVTLEDFQITRLNFPSHPTMEDQYRAMLLSLRGQSVKVIPLDHLEAILAVSSDAVKAKAETVVNDPPQIFYSPEPSLLVLVDGPAVLKDLTGDYQRVINTRNVMVYNKVLKNYYLYADSQWFEASDLIGPWYVPDTTPSDIDDALSAALATRQVDPLYPQTQDAPPVAQVFVSTTPAELLESTGAPNLVSVPGTDLLYVENTSNAIFYDIDDNNYYVLISGRWFKAPNLSGGWAFVQPGQLPGDFKKIPPDSEKSNVLMSVPGTPQAQEAVIANSIPQTASIQRDQATLKVTYYGGTPSFTPIAGTTLAYAANSQTPIIMVAPNNYYACQGGVWFESATSAGPWAVATLVPPVIYTIPTSCPINYVTYSYIYGYTPSVVYVGYTPGYMGTVVAPGGVVVYGTGYYYPPVVYGTVYVAYPPTYGYGASFALGAAVGFSFGFAAAHCCEPAWGCYHWAGGYGYSYSHVNVNSCNYYNHWGATAHTTSSYGYNAYNGNEYANRSTSTFNPYTGAHGYGNSSASYNPYSGNASAQRNGSWSNPSSGANAQASSYANANRYNGNYSGGRQGSAYNPQTGSGVSGSSSVQGNAYNGNYSTSKQGSYNNAATGESASGQRTTTGNAFNGTSTSSGSGSAYNSKTGNSASWNNGSMTSDRDGNTYSYNEGDTSQNRSEAQSEHSAQSTGEDRYNNWSHSGGGSSRWGGGGGFHGGGGFRR